MYRELIINAETGEETWRDFTPDEIAKIEQAQAKAAQFGAELAAKEKARREVLEKLGLTEDEAKMILG